MNSKRSRKNVICYIYIYETSKSKAAKNTKSLTKQNYVDTKNILSRNNMKLSRLWNLKLGYRVKLRKVTYLL